MSELLPPIIDWIASNAPRKWRRRPPIAAEALDDLLAWGAPPELVALYAGGAHSPGVFPRCSVAEAHLLHPRWVVRAPGTNAWRFTRPDTDRVALAMHPDGTVSRIRHDGPVPRSRAERGSDERWDPEGHAVPVDELLTAHLEALLDGRLTFNPHLACHLYPDERVELSWANGMKRSDLTTVHRWVHRAREALSSGRHAELGGFGELRFATPRQRRERAAMEYLPTRAGDVRFVQEKTMQEVLRGDANIPAEPPVSDLARSLAAGVPVGILGLGAFEVQHVAARTRVTRRGPIAVPAATFIGFEAWRSLERLLR